MPDQDQEQVHTSSPTSLVYFTFTNNTTVPGVGLINDEDIVIISLDLDTLGIDTSENVDGFSLGR